MEELLEKIISKIVKRFRDFTRKICDRIEIGIIFKRDQRNIGGIR